MDGGETDGGETDGGASLPGASAPSVTCVVAAVPTAVAAQPAGDGNRFVAGDGGDVAATADNHGSVPAVAPVALSSGGSALGGNVPWLEAFRASLA